MIKNPVLALILCVAFLALGGIFVRLSLLAPINTAFYRMLFALPIFYALAISRGNPLQQARRHLNLQNKALCLLSGAFLALDLVLWNISFAYTTVVNANLLCNLVAFTVVPLSYCLFKEKPQHSFYLSAPLMIIGLLLLLSTKSQQGTQPLLGNLLALATSFFYGLFLITIYRLRSRIDVMVLMYYSCIGSLLTLIPFVCYEGWQLPSSFRAIYPLLGLALLSQVLGQGGLSYVLGHVNAILASLLMLSQPAISALYAFLLFGEQLTLQQALAIAVILLGLFIGKLDNQRFAALGYRFKHRFRAE